MASNSGGAAGAGGHEYQAESAAYYAAAMLCAPAFPVGWGLPSGTAVEAVRCETGGAVDDILLLLSTGDSAEIQAKRAVTADRSATSPLGKTLRQFVVSYLDSDADGPDAAAGRRPTRLVLATSGSASRSIREDLPQLIARAAGDPATALDAVPQTSLCARRTVRVGTWARTRTGTSRVGKASRRGDVPRSPEADGLGVRAASVGDRPSEKGLAPTAPTGAYRPTAPVGTGPPVHLVASMRVAQPRVDALR